MNKTGTVVRAIVGDQWYRVESRSVIMAISFLTAAGSVNAIPIDVGSSDFNVRWDNTAKYNYAHRVESQDDNILASVNNDDGDRNFDKGMVSNRVDILSEFDVIYRRKYGFRISAAAWYDDAYRNLDGGTSPTSNHLENGVPASGLSSESEEGHKGASAEVLDAFLFGRVDIGDTPVNIKVGRHTVSWGESIFSPFHGVGYGQAALDLRKLASVPGTEAKELLIPRNAISAQAQVSQELSIAAQYFLDWDSFRVPESGSYLGQYDMMLDGGETLITGPGTYYYKGKDVTPGTSGDWGISSRWRPEWLSGSLGFYARNTSDIQPQLHIDPVAEKYYLVYPDDIRLYGLSLSNAVSDFSLGMDLNYRTNMPLNSDAVLILPAPAAAVTPGAITSLPSSGDTGGARGDTVHAVVNLLGSMTTNAAFDEATWLAELQYNRWNKVTQGEDVFLGRDSYSGIDKVSKNFVGLTLNITPTWFQALPGIDLKMPINYAVGLSGNSAVATGGNEGAGSYSVGVSADVYQRYQLDLKYVDFFGPYRRDTATGTITSNGLNPLLRDRGFLAFTFKTTF
ncbi:DUF1302 domain-containing protein [Oceanobacter antarcticus]|uniref:DUF1302 domain-containing protein n=1 Tax=Oceanobacter antarcticus TaxID=3133425 RepID=A0ABW8NEV9_9GAMM